MRSCIETIISTNTCTLWQTKSLSLSFCVCLSFSSYFILILTARTNFLGASHTLKHFWKCFQKQYGNIVKIYVSSLTSIETFWTCNKSNMCPKTLKIFHTMHSHSHPHSHPHPRPQQLFLILVTRICDASFFSFLLVDFCCVHSFWLNKMASKEDKRAVKKNWAKNEICKLIEAFEARPDLWDPSRRLWSPERAWDWGGRF